jgi:Protein of unknown function (DUF3710)
VARRGRGTAADPAAGRAAAPDGVDDALNGDDPPGARTIGAIAVARWAARDPGESPEGPDEGRAPQTQGPYDEGDLDPEHTEADRVDFGAVRIPVPRGGQVSVEPEEGRLQAVHVMLPAGRLSVSALAAPRSARLWPDLAAEIDESLREGGATVRSFTGPWGRELHARTGEAASVFVGVDGPRWMLYGVATGPTGAARELDAALRRMLRGVVVVRGRAPYPVRTVLPLTVPEHLAPADPEPAAAERPPSVRNGRFARRSAAPGRPGPTGVAASPALPRSAPVPDPTAVPDPGGVPTEPHGLRHVRSAGTNGHAHGRTPHLNGASAASSYRAAEAALRPAPDRRDPLPAGNGRPPTERVDPEVTSTGQRRVADLLAQAQRDRAAQEAQREARERAAAQQARDRAVQEARERAAQEARERAAQEARERAALERAAQERAAQEARERAAQEHAAQERAAQEARERAAHPPAADRPVWPPATPQPSVLAAPPPADPVDPVGGVRNGRRRDDHYRDPYRSHSDDIEPLRLGGAPRHNDAGAAESRHDPAWPSSVSDLGADRRQEATARPTPDGSDDWTVPMSVVPPESAQAAEATPGRPEHDLWAGDPWAAEARRAARAAQAAERRQGRPASPAERGPREQDPGHPPHHRAAHQRPAHQRPAHERPGDAPAVDVPSARVPPPVLPAWAHLRDDPAEPWPDPYDEPPSGRHRRPER